MAKRKEHDLSKIPLSPETEIAALCVWNAGNGWFFIHAPWGLAILEQQYGFTYAEAAEALGRNEVCRTKTNARQARNVVR